VVAGVLLGVVGMGGCAGPGWAALGGPSSGTTLQALGDWNDLDAAMEVSAPKVELALENVETVADGRGRLTRVWTLRGIRDESAEVRATARESGDERELEAAGTIAIDLNASVGRLGDSVREKTLLDLMRQRLGKLSGVDYAPLR